MPPKDGWCKSQLQELCQSMSWPLPHYTTVKGGPPQSPYFEATVVVNGLSFQTSHFLKRAKDAQIQAAKIALYHFTSSPPAPDIAQTSNTSINVNKRPITDEIRTPIEQEQVQKALGAKRSKHSGELHMYKNKLQNLVMKKGYTLPVYTFEREGPLHDSRFKSKVIVNGQTYESPDSFRTLKESEHAAAKIALFSLLPHESQEFSLDNSFFKNLLQEFTQKSGLELPTYDTTGFGVSHMPTFVSTVVVGGKTFIGEEAKTKKLAEINAAKLAYTCLSHRSDQEAPKQIPQIGSTDSLGSPNLDRSTQKRCGTPSPATHAGSREAVEYIPLPQIKGSSPQIKSEWVLLCDTLMTR
uniref:DRBM domain-containing protein n=1 Tax=Kalanchoe fedtschenkoi TaxID=63787 RepID=A0A7N0UWP9_KALFE